MPPSPLTILTGFLGSGKTTLLSKLLKRPEMAGTAIIINEFGEVGLDDLLVQTPAEKPILLQNGCLCCTVRGDLATTLQDLLLQRSRGQFAFQRVIIETTGLADPAPIVHTLITDPGICDYFSLEGVVTLVDCANGQSTLEQHPEAAKQAAIADRLLLTKQDLVTPAAIEELRRSLIALNPGASMVAVTHGDVDPAQISRLSLFDPRTKSVDVQNWLRAEAYEEAHDHTRCNVAGCDHISHGHSHHANEHRHKHHIRSACLLRDRPIKWNNLSRWLDQLIKNRGAEMLRVKGIVNVLDCPGEPIVIHGVQQIFHPPIRLQAWPCDDTRTRIVLIMRDCDDAEIAAEFAALD